MQDKKITGPLQVNPACEGIWFKADLNNDGKTDLVICGMEGLPEVYAIVSDSNGYKEEATTEFWDRDIRDIDNGIVPALIQMDSQKLLVLQHYVKAHDGAVNYYTDTDTLIFKYNNFLNYRSDAGKYKIEKITLYNDGECEGDCPVIHAVIDPSSMAGKYSWQYHMSHESFEGIIPPEKVALIVKICTYANLPDFNEYKYIVDDGTTTTWNITYDGGKEKTIINHGSTENLTEQALFQLFRSEMKFRSK